jgi:transposase
MARYAKIELEAHLSSDELKARYRQCKAAKEARRWQILWLASKGMPIGTIATTVGVHRNWARTVIKRYNAGGPDSVVDQHTQRPGGRRAVLNAEQEQALHSALEARPADGGRWTGRKVAAWIALQTGRSRVHPQLGWVYLCKLGFTPQIPRPRHRAAATADEQAAWKKS